MRSILVTVSIAAILILSGCAGANETSSKAASEKALRGVARTVTQIDEAAYDRVKALMDGVPCNVESVGDETTKNLLYLGNVSLEHGGTQSLDTRGDIMVAATSGGLGLAIVNISDPLEPETYSYFDVHKGYGDVKISPDNMTAIGGAGGVIDLVDIRNPFEPLLVGQFDLASPGKADQGFLNAHMLYAAEIKGEQWVFLAPNNNDGVWILKLVGPPEERALEFVTNTLPVEGGPLGPHDMWVQYDTDLAKWLLYSADGFHGWTVFDVSDPANPTFAGGIVRPETGYTHTIQAAKINGKRIVATIAEVGFNLLEVYDATNLLAPILLGTWHVMESNAVVEPAAPQHEFNIVDGKLYLGHYANGVYIFDLTTLGSTPLLGTAELQPVAHYKQGTPTPTGLFSDVWSVDVINGLLYVSSMKNGIHVVGYGCLTPGDARLVSTG